MKTIQYILFLLISITFTVPSIAQNVIPCATDEVTQDMYNQNPELERQRQSMEEAIYKLTQEQGKLSKKATVYIIPVVFHVIHQYGPENISKTLIEQSMAQLNNDFRGRNSDTSTVHQRWKNSIADMEIEFRLATKDPNGNCTQGIVRVDSDATNEPGSGEVQKLSRWNPERYLNIYVVRDISSQDGFTTAGYAYLPPASPQLDGIVIDYNFLGTGQRTLTHEAGHYLALLHPFQGGCGNAGANCNLQGDRVCDTPPTKERNFGCNQNQNTCNTESPDLPDQVENHMDYSSCSRMFTEGQKTRARSAITSYRSTLVSESNNIFTGTDKANTTVNCKPIADFYSSSGLACAGQNIRFTNNSYNGTTTNIKWYFTGGTPATSNSNSPDVVYSSPGTYSVKLVVSNSNGADSLTKTGYIKVQSNIGIYEAPYTEDFENINLAQDGWETTSTHNTIKWQVTSQAGASGTSSLYLNNRSVFNNGDVFTFIMPSVDLRQVTNPKLKFKVAYTRVTSTSSDLLRIFVSRNCGISYALRHIATANVLSGNKPFVSGNYVPGQDDWIDVSVDLNNFANAEGLVIKFDLVNGGGNNVYFDDIQVTGDQQVGIANNAEFNFNLYPNPNTLGTTFFMEFTAKENNTLIIEAFDFTGKKIAVKEPVKVFRGENKVELNTRGLNISAPGIYLIKARIGDAVIVRKLTVFNN